MALYFIRNKTLWLIAFALTCGWHALDTPAHAQFKNDTIRVSGEILMMVADKEKSPYWFYANQYGTISPFPPPPRSAWSTPTDGRARNASSCPPVSVPSVTGQSTAADVP